MTTGCGSSRSTIKDVMWHWYRHIAIKLSIWCNKLRRPVSLCKVRKVFRLGNFTCFIGFNLYLCLSSTMCSSTFLLPALLAELMSSIPLLFIPFLSYVREILLDRKHIFSLIASVYGKVEFASSCWCCLLVMRLHLCSLSKMPFPQPRKWQWSHLLSISAVQRTFSLFHHPS